MLIKLILGVHTQYWYYTKAYNYSQEIKCLFEHIKVRRPISKYTYLLHVGATITYIIVIDKEQF